MDGSAAGGGGGGGGGEIKVFLAADVAVAVRLRVEAIEGPPPPPLSPGRAADGWPYPPEVYVEACLYIGGTPFSVPSRTRLATWDGKACRWSEWVALTAKVRDLTADAQLALTVWDVSDPREEVALAGTTLGLVGQRSKRLKAGRRKLQLWRGQAADGVVPTSTPGKMAKDQRGEIERLEKLASRHEQGQVCRVEWLDRLALRAVDVIAREERECRERDEDPGGEAAARRLYLTVELPAFEHPITLLDDFVAGGASIAPAPSKELVLVLDPEVGRQDPAELKQLKLARSLARGAIDRDLKPNSTERREIAVVLGHPPTRSLSSDERQLLWRFRFSLTLEKRALTKFLAAVDWSDMSEARQATELMHRWAPIDIADALELLSPAFSSQEVRAYAVSVLARAGDKELRCYLLQLVQALRYERSNTSRLASFLVSRAVQNSELGNFLHWYLMVEWQDTHNYSNRFSVTHHKFAGKEGEAMWEQIRRQSELAAQLCATMKEVRSVRGNHHRRVERLRQLLSSQGLLGELTHFSQPLPLPLDPRLSVVGLIPGDSTIFKSSLSPLMLTFRTQSDSKYRLIFKKGDDMRQDQLVVQTVALMDRLLKQESLDLRLTTYQVLATGADDGMVEFVPSLPLAQVLAENKTIVKYLQQFHPEDGGPFGLAPDCLDTFVRSCAGYCVIMYILGVGDRHLDNLLLCEDGRLFHIDFGFILGRDPKPFPPPMKLCKEMVEAMGGADSTHYSRFKSYCCEAYNILRKSANLIMNLFHLMAGANIPDIALDPEKAILKLQEKFRLDLDDEAAVQFFQTLITESVSALFPQMVETIHRWAQYWR
eukprot:SM000020S05994  [mRNA]  locus=s20:381175:386922:+ [translate_table: standard]